MLLCESCGAVFPVPRLGVYREWDSDGRERREPWCACPFCGESQVVTALPCEGEGEDCLGWRSPQALLCPACQEALRRQTAGFVRRLSQPRRDQLDQWLEGAGVQQFL